MIENNIIEADKLPRFELFLSRDKYNVQRYVLDYSINNTEEPAFQSSYLKQIRSGTYMACILEVDTLIVREDEQDGLHAVIFPRQTAQEALAIFKEIGDRPEHEKKMWLHRGKDDRSVKYGFDVPKGSLMVEMKFDKVYDNTLSGEAIIIEGAFNKTDKKVN